MRTLAILLILPLAAASAPAQQETDHLHINQVSESFLRKWAAAEESRNTKDLLDLYKVANETLQGELIQPDPEVDRWIPLTRLLAAKLAQLPDGALETHETIARQEFETVLEPVQRRKAAEKYAYTKAGREALEQISNGESDRGRMVDAMRGWSRALEVRPGAETVARLAFAHAQRNDVVSLAGLRAQARTASIKGEITVCGRKRELYEYLDSLIPERREGPAPAAPALLPTPEIPLGRYDMREDGRYGDRLAVSLPGMGQVGGRTLVVISNGLRVLAVDPAKAEGGPIDDCIEWRWPRGVLSRTYTLGNYNTSLPYVGATVAGDRIFCPMFNSHQEARQQRGRRSQTFLGASVLRALNLATGEPLWDTETVEVEVNGVKKPLLEHLKLENSDFCFGGPPVVRGERVYAAIMTSPATGRRCWVLCLDASTGQPVWFTEVATAPQSHEMSIALLEEEEGTIALSTNFGIVASLDSRSGAVEWLVKYMGPHSTRVKRPARVSGSPPVIAGSLVYVLAQDCDDLLAFDRWTGLEAALPKRSQEIDWEKTVHLLGRAGDWLVISGSPGVAIRPRDGEVIRLPDSEGSRDRCGRGVISGGFLLLPTRNELSIIDTATWKLSETLKWTDSNNPGNILLAGPYLVHQSDRLDLYTSAALLKERLGAKADADPADPQACRQMARILESSGRAKESVPYYRRALRVWEKNPDWQETADGLRKKLADLAEKLGAEFPKE